MNGERYDHALAGALLILETLDDLADPPRHVLLSNLVFILMHMLESYEADARAIEPSRN